jgi:gas vesicle protein
MEQLGLDFNRAADYARRGKNSAVLKRINYYCHHDILRDGNTLVDLPGIDAPVERDAELTYRKIADPETSAVICVLKVADAGEMTIEETKLLETMRENEGISDRVFYVFNRIDETWYNSGKQQRLQELLESDFREAQRRNRVFETSALLGFYGSQVRQKSLEDQFGLRSIFLSQVQAGETPQFVQEFNRYCFLSGKLNDTEFDISTSTRETANEKYLNALSKYPHPLLIDQLIQDSGVQDFSIIVNRYLSEEKRPELFKNLAKSIHDTCYRLNDSIAHAAQQLMTFSNDPRLLKEQKLAKVSQELQQAADQFKEHMGEEIQRVIEGTSDFEKAFTKLEAKMSGTLLELLERFSYWDAYERARKVHPNYVKAPLLTILGEAFYYLASELELVLAEEVKTLTFNLFRTLVGEIRQRSYYRQLTRLLGNEHPINLIDTLHEVEQRVMLSLLDQVHSECELYVQEDPKIYSNSGREPGIYQFQEALRQVFHVSISRKELEKIEPTIRQLLEIDFQNKVNKTTQESFRYRVSSTLNQYLGKMVEQQYTLIIQQDDHAREYARQTIDNEIEQAIAAYQKAIREAQQKIEKYNIIMTALNLSLIELGLEEFILATLTVPQLT